MIHRMKLSPSAFRSVSSGKKTVEMRLNDEKRAAIKIGDEIEFENTATFETVRCAVADISKFKNFFNLYSDFDKISIGYNENQTANPEDMYAYYSPEQIEKYGVLAIKIKLL